MEISFYMTLSVLYKWFSDIIFWHHSFYIGSAILCDLSNFLPINNDIKVKINNSNYNITLYLGTDIYNTILLFITYNKQFLGTYSNKKNNVLYYYFNIISNLL